MYQVTIHEWQGYSRTFKDIAIVWEGEDREKADSVELAVTKELKKKDPDVKRG